MLSIFEVSSIYSINDSLSKISDSLKSLTSLFGISSGFKSEKNSSLICDGEMQGILAFNKEILKENYPFTELVNGEVNVLIFPNLAAGNIAYTLLQEVGGADSIGPILLGMKKPVHVLQLGSSIRSIFNMAVIAVVDAQAKNKSNVQEVVRRSKWWRRKAKTNS